MSLKVLSAQMLIYDHLVTSILYHHVVSCRHSHIFKNSRKKVKPAIVVILIHYIKASKHKKITTPRPMPWWWHYRLSVVKPMLSSRVRFNYGSLREQRRNWRKLNIVRYHGTAVRGCLTPTALERVGDR